MRQQSYLFFSKRDDNIPTGTQGVWEKLRFSTPVSRFISQTIQYKEVSKKVRVLIRRNNQKSHDAPSLWKANMKPHPSFRMVQFQWPWVILSDLAIFQWHEASRGLSATAELFVSCLVPFRAGDYKLVFQHGGGNSNRSLLRWEGAVERRFLKR